MPLPHNRTAFELRITPGPDDIDELGHVNNAVYVRWLQEIATAHWVALADPADVEAYLWVASRHEIDYRRAILPGESVTGRTWGAAAPKGAKKSEEGGGGTGCGRRCR